MALDPVLANPNIQNEVGLEDYVSRFERKFTKLQESADAKRRSQLDYRRLVKETGSHIRARIEMAKLSRREEDHKINLIDQERRAAVTSQELQGLARRTATMGPPTLNSAVRRELSADKTESKKYEEVRTLHTAEAWRKRFYSGLSTGEANLQ